MGGTVKEDEILNYSKFFCKLQYEWCSFRPKWQSRPFLNRLPCMLAYLWVVGLKLDENECSVIIFSLSCLQLNTKKRVWSVIPVVFEFADCNQTSHCWQRSVLAEAYSGWGGCWIQAPCGEDGGPGKPPTPAGCPVRRYKTNRLTSVDQSNVFLVI